MKIYTRISLLILAFVFSAIGSEAQTGGKYEFQFLTLPNSPRVAAMGSNFLTIYDGDISLSLSNPSLINEKMHKQVGINYTDYRAAASHVFLNYGHSFEKIGNFVGSLQYINYGKFDGKDVNEEPTGPFSASNYAFNVGWGRQLDTIWSIGANLKTIFSNYETYKSFGVAVDVAGSYIPNESFTASLLFRNIGRQITTYENGEKVNLPFEIQAGFSQKLAHFPLRFSMLFQHLQRWDLTAPKEIVLDPFTGNPEKTSRIGDFSDKFFRHIVFGGEFIPTKNFSVRIGYNYHRRQELKNIYKHGLTGFSAGFGFKVSRFSFNYARAAYHLAGSPNYFSIMIDLK